VHGAAGRRADPAVATVTAVAAVADQRRLAAVPSGRA
jgi:hypothetical protein